MKKRTQSSTEYALFITALIAAAVWFRVYFMNAYSGYYKKYSDSLGQEQFSPEYSDYTQVRETLPFETSIQKGRAEEEAGYYSKAVTGEDGQVSYVHSGSINAVTAEDAGINVNPMGSVVLEAAFRLDGLNDEYPEMEIADGFGAMRMDPDEFPVDYTVSDSGTVVDDFSDVKLAEDAMYK